MSVSAYFVTKFSKVSDSGLLTHVSKLVMPWGGSEEVQLRMFFHQLFCVYMYVRVSASLPHFGDSECLSIIPTVLLALR